MVARALYIFLFTISIQPIYSQKLFKALTPAETGITFQNTLKETPELNIITYEYYYNGGGVAAADFNNDGLTDLYFTGNLTENKLYINRSTPAVGGKQGAVKFESTTTPSIGSKREAVKFESATTPSIGVGKGEVKFEDITKTAGVGGRRGWKTGVSVADVNGDGFQDIYVCYSGDVEPKQRRNQLFINNGNLTFTDKAREMGIDDAGHTTQAAFFDMDRDGDLDLFVLNHNVKQFRNFDAAFVKKMIDPDAGDRLYRNDNNKFTDITQKAGISSNPLGYGLGISITDVNNDGWADLYVTNDYVEQDYLYLNNKNGTFTDVLAKQMGHISNFSMGVDAADVNNDGWTDIFTLDMLPEDNRRQKLLYAPDNFEIYNNMLQNGFYHQLMRNMLQLNNGNGTFSEVGQFAGISNTDWSWSALFADYNNDGYQDLFVTNGYGRDMINRDFMKFYANERTKHLLGKTDDKMFTMLQTITATPLRNYMYENKGNVQFADRSNDWGFEGADFAHGAVYADLDNDGDLDIVFNRMNQEVGVYQNRTREESKGKNYIQLQLKGSQKNLFGIGAKATVYTASGKYMRENFPVRGFQSSINAPLHIAFPDTKIDSIAVVWANGDYQVLKDNLPINQRLQITQNPDRQFVVQAKNQNPIFRYPTDTLPYKHQEPMVNDFKVQPLMPNMVSYHGPKMAVGDVNKDGLNDLYMCSPEGQAGTLLLQEKTGSFKVSNQIAFVSDVKYEDTDATFFDADADGDLDLYVVSGGFGNTDSGLPLQDRFYENLNGSFVARPQQIPQENAAGSVVVAWDFDKDGDKDLFVGARVEQGKYPLAPKSMLLVNDGKGNFTNKVDKATAIFGRLGMVTDAVVVDLDNDQNEELIVCGEWAAVRIFGQKDAQIQDITPQFLEENLLGWWITLYANDLDNDGDMDIVAGNWGTNAQFKPTAEQPMELYYADFDQNGFIDPIWCYAIQGKNYPAVSRDEITDQMVGLRPKFVTYTSFADATITDLITSEQLTKAPRLEANFLETVWFENKNGKLEKHSLPQEANYAPVHAILADDFDGDGHKDLLLAGNVEYTRIRTGKSDANYGCLLKGDGKGNFSYVPQLASGLQIKGCVRSLQPMTDSKGNKQIVVGINNDTPLILKLNKQ